MRRALAAAAILLFFRLESSALTSGSAVEGRREARSDIRDGKLILRTYGYAAGARTKYAELLRERLGVETVAVAGCVVDASIVAETAAYNEVMKAEIAKRFGADALEKIRVRSGAPAPPPATGA